MGWQIRKCPIYFFDFEQCVMKHRIGTNNAIAYRSSMLDYQIIRLYANCIRVISLMTDKIAPVSIIERITKMGMIFSTNLQIL